VLISKKLILAELLVNSDDGKIWINAPNCILRIQGLNFKNKKEKFSMIDINESSASMLEGNLVTSNLENFIDEIMLKIYAYDFTEDEQKEILNFISNIKRGR